MSARQKAAARARVRRRLREVMRGGQAIRIGRYAVHWVGWRFGGRRWGSFRIGSTVVLQRWPLRIFVSAKR